MQGRIVVMEPQAYETWLAGGPPPESPLAAGEKLFTDMGCITCHRPDSAERAPLLAGIYGKPVLLSTGEKVTADDAYIRESIVTPVAKVVAGYQPVMPTYAGQLGEEDVAALIAFIKSLPPLAGDAASRKASDLRSN